MHFDTKILYICFNMHIKISKSPRLKFTAHLIISSLVSIHLACKVIILVFHKICKENEFKINKQVSFAGNYSFAQNVFLRKMIQIMHFLEIHQCFKTFLSILFFLFCDVLKIIFRLYVTSRIHYQRFWSTFSYMYIQAIWKESLNKKMYAKNWFWGLLSVKSWHPWSQSFIVSITYRGLIFKLNTARISA